MHFMLCVILLQGLHLDAGPCRRPMWQVTTWKRLCCIRQCFLLQFIVRRTHQSSLKDWDWQVWKIRQRLSRLEKCHFLKLRLYCFPGAEVPSGIHLWNGDVRFANFLPLTHINNGIGLLLSTPSSNISRPFQPYFPCFRLNAFWSI